MNFTEKIESLLLNSDLEYNPREFLIRILIYGLGFGVGFALIFFNYSLHYSLIIGFSIFILTELFAYASLILASNKRIAIIEDVLPDFLTIMASNIRSGLTPDRALLLSARKEFGPLTKEIDRAAKKTITGTPFTEAFMEMGKRIDSEIFSKTIRLIVEGVRSGGNLAELLENTSLDIRRFSAIRKEVSATVMTYELFIFAAAAIGAPLLYSVSTFLVELVSKMKSEFTLSSSQASQILPLFQSQNGLSIEATFLFSIAAIILTAIFGSFIAGVISKGKESEGIQYLPIMVIISIGIYFAAKSFLELFLGGLFLI